MIFLNEPAPTGTKPYIHTLSLHDALPIHQCLGTTTIYVTHDQIEAMTMADKIVVMHDGNVEQIGAPLDLYDHPANLFVAGFIGSPAMNFIEGRVSLNGTAPFIHEAGGAHPLNGAPGPRGRTAAPYG